MPKGLKKDGEAPVTFLGGDRPTCAGMGPSAFSRESTARAQ
jgi:hypothetical protein